MKLSISINILLFLTRSTFFLVKYRTYKNILKLFCVLLNVLSDRKISLTSKLNKATGKQTQRAAASAGVYTETMPESCIGTTANMKQRSFYASECMRLK